MTKAAGGSVPRWAERVERVDVGGSATAARSGDPMGYPPVLDHGMIEGIEGALDERHALAEQTGTAHHDNNLRGWW